MTTKRSRVVTSKHSKGACRTCRIRRVKCDEGRPSCQRCVSTGRQCDGYSPGTSPRSECSPKRPIEPLLLAQPDSSLITNHERSVSKLRITDHERMSFGYFVQEMAAPLARISHAPDWIPFALQVSFEQPAVLYALIAVGSGATAQTRIEHHSLTRLRSPAHDNLALNQYCKATAAVQKYIDLVASGGASIGPVLLCSLLFVVFESMRNESHWALSHLRHGRRAIRSVSHLSDDEKAALLPMVSWSPVMTEDLLSKMDDFELESTTLDVPRSPVADLNPSHAKPLFGSLPTRFDSIEHAKTVLNDIIALTSKWEDEMLALANKAIDRKSLEPLTPAIKYCLAHTLSRVINVGSNSFLESRREQLLQSHRHWLSLIEALHEERHSRSLRFMRIQQFVSNFTLSTARTTSERNYDNFEKDFARVLDQIGDYLNDAAAPPPTLKHPVDLEVRLSFSLEPGILPALYGISLKCRIPHLRKRALDLLHSANRREGSNWSGELHTYAESIIGLEEREAQHLLSELDGKSSDLSYNGIPEAARFCDIVVEGVSLQSIRMICSRYVPDDTPSIEILELSGSGEPPLQLQELGRFSFQISGT